jgi:uncharacterized protein YndB with AHSA1/START domain/DNA-binding transcriptional ArsR family regulator
MLNYHPSLDSAFRALSDPTRRAILERLSRGPASVSEIADPLPMSLPAVHQHLQVLEECGLMEWEKKGRVRWCRLDRKGLAAAEDWVLGRRASGERRREGWKVMTKPSVVHDTIQISRIYGVPHARIFRAWTVKEEMGWLGPGDKRWNTRVVEQELRIGGKRIMTFGPDEGPHYAEECIYVDIVDDRRLCFAETVKADGESISVSMVTIQFNPLPDGTEVIVTDQLAFLDGGDTPAGRREGWDDTIGKLDRMFGG